MAVNAVGKEFFEAMYAYLAGFLDADGAIMATIEKHKEMKFGFRVRVVVKITQKNREILDWFCQTFKVGKVYRNRTTYDWMIKDKSEIRKILEDAKPYLRVKKIQAEKVLKIIDMVIDTKERLYEMAEIADSLSKFNVRSEKRRLNTAAMVKENILP